MASRTPGSPGSPGSPASAPDTSQAPAYNPGWPSSPSIPHLVGFTLATILAAIALGCLRLLLLGCRPRRRFGLEDSAALEEDLARRQRGRSVEQDTPAAQAGSKEQQVCVMVVMPDENICCGLQLSAAADGAGGKAALEAGVDGLRAAKLVDAASEAELRIEGRHENLRAGIGST